MIKKLIGIIFAIALCIGIIPAADAMHIMEGFISPGYCILWGVLSLPFLVMGFMSIKKKITEHRRTLILLAISGAFIFVISSLKIPSVTGSCSHMTGTGLGAILFGCKRFRNYSTAFSGRSACPRRTYYNRCKYIFNGNCRPVYDIWYL